MLYLALLLTIGYVGYLVWEKRTNDKRLASFQWVIHVNGIRGKTSVCRLIDAVLRGAGYRVFTKTTGTDAAYIDTRGQEHPIRRLGPANIREQLSMIRRASREQAQVLILECMAVDPVLQDVAQSKIVKGQLNVITNVRYDHTFVMGETLEEIADSLSATIPQNGLLFTADEGAFARLKERCDSRGTQAVLCRPNAVATNENLAIAYEIGKYLGISDADFQKHIQGYQEDFGANKLYVRGKLRFLNLFSVNDPQSTQNVLAHYQKEGEALTVVFNNRMDRPDRLVLFARRFFPQVPCRKIIVIGENRGLAVRVLKRCGAAQIEARRDWRSILELAEDGLVVGVGNIKGPAYEIIRCLEGGTENE